MRVYYHQRMDGEALVEYDFIVYQFDGRTEELLARKASWRDDLPETLPADLLDGEAAEAMVVHPGDRGWIVPDRHEAPPVTTVITPRVVRNDRTLLRATPSHAILSVC